jgi:hypothetical protein
MGYHPADIWEQQATDEREQYLQDTLEEGRFQDAREDTLYKFSENNSNVSKKGVEAYAKMWATAYLGPDNEIGKEADILATELELDLEDAYLILWKRDEYLNTLSNYERDKFLDFSAYFNGDYNGDEDE